MRSGAGPSQHGRIRRVRENGTYRSARSVSRPSSGGSVPPSSFEATDLRQPTRIASTGAGAAGRTRSAWCDRRSQPPPPTHRHPPRPQTSRALPAGAAAHRVVLPQHPRSTAADGTAAVPKVATAVRHGAPEYPLSAAATASPRRASAPSTAIHARSPTAPSTPMLRVVRRIARCRSLRDAGRGPYSPVSLEMLPIQLPIVPVNLFV